jgi:hypothetical protein
MKLGSMKAETIVTGIMVCIAVLIICPKIPFLSNLFIPAGAEITSFMSVLANIQFYLVIIGSLVIELILLRLFCEVIYNIVTAAKCIISDKDNRDQNLQE